MAGHGGVARHFRVTEGEGWGGVFSRRVEQHFLGGHWGLGLAGGVCRGGALWQGSLGVSSLLGCFHSLERGAVPLLPVVVVE